MRIPRVVLDRAGTFLLALLLAVVVWVVSQQQQNPLEVRTLSRVPVTARNLPQDLVLADDNSFSPVDVQVRAPRSVWEVLTTSDLLAYVDLSGAQPGRQEIPVTIDPQIPEVDILNVNPSAMVVRLEANAQKQVPVVARILDTPPLGYIRGGAIITPTTVAVSGAASLVDTVRQAEVPVRLLDARSDVQVTDFVTLRDQNGGIVTGLTVTPRTVSVTVPVSQEQGFSEKPVLPKIEGQPAPSYLITSVTADPATVTLTGDPDALKALPAYVETVPISIAGATEDIQERVPLQVPETVSVRGSQSVVVKIGIQAIEGSLTMTLRPVVQGLGSGLACGVDLSPHARHHPRRPPAAATDAY